MVRLLDPATGEDGWTRDVMVIQIVTDDMPHLVEAVIGKRLQPSRPLLRSRWYLAGRTAAFGP